MVIISLIGISIVIGIVLVLLSLLAAIGGVCNKINNKKVKEKEGCNHSCNKDGECK